MTEDSSGNKLKRQRGEGSQTDDCGDSSLAEQVAEINMKVKKLKEASENTASEISNLKTTAVYTCANMDATTRELNGLKEEIENLKRRNIKLEADTRREDIKIFGIKESAAETNEKNRRTCPHYVEIEDADSR